MLASTLERIERSSARAVPVVEDGRLVGLVTMEHIGEFLMVQDALRRRRAAA